MTLNHEVFVDWDGNGFHCKDAAPGDPANLIDSGLTVTLGNFKRRVTGSGGSVTPVDQATDYSVQYLFWVTGGAAGASLEIGFDGTNTDLSVTPGQTYTLVLWLSSNNPVSATFQARYAPSGSTLATSSINIAPGAETQFTLTFTVTPGVTNIYAYLTKAALSSYQIYVRGIMLVAGSTAPAAFNAGAISLYENISRWMIEAQWNLGFKSPFQYVSDLERASLTVKNDSRIFSPEYAAGALYGYHKAGHKTLIEVDYGSGFTTMFTGWLKTIEPTPGINHTRTAKLEIHGIRQFVDKVNVNVPLQQNATALEIVEAILDELNLPVTNADSGGVPRGGTGDSDTLTYPYAGDNWDSIDALRAITDVVKARQAKVSFDRSGNLVYLTPQWFVGNTADIAVTLDNSMIGMRYEWGNVINQVSVHAYERELSSATDDILWRTAGGSSSWITLASGQSVVLDVDFFQPDTNAKVSGTDVYLDTVTYSGPTLTSSIEATATSARITLANNNISETPIVITAVIVKGKKLTAFGETVIVAENADSIADYGKTGLDIDAKTMNTPEEANSIAHYNLARFKDPYAIIRSVTFVANRNNENLLEFGAPSVQLGVSTAYTVRIIDDQTGHDNYHVIVGESHLVNDDGHRVTWYLEPVVRAMRLNDSVFGVLGSMFVGIE